MVSELDLSSYAPDVVEEAMAWPLPTCNRPNPLWEPEIVSEASEA